MVFPSDVHRHVESRLITGVILFRLNRITSSGIWGKRGTVHCGEDRGLCGSLDVSTCIRRPEEEVKKPFHAGNPIAENAKSISTHLTNFCRLRPTSVLRRSWLVRRQVVRDGAAEGVEEMMARGIISAREFTIREI